MRPRARVPAYSKKVRRVLRENAALKYIATVTKKLVSAQPLSVPSLPVSLYQVGKSVYNDTMVIPCGLYPGNNAGIDYTLYQSLRLSVPQFSFITINPTPP